MNPNIESKVVVITGASSGLGEEMARHLAEKGAKVVLGARRAEKLETIVEEITSSGGVADCLAMDVTAPDEVEALVKKAHDNYGRVDVMINNAGVMSLAPMRERKVEEWNRMIDINVKGVLHGIAAALPIFEEQKSGHFINISSVAGIKVFPDGGVYCGTKFAVRAISEGLRMEAGEHIRTTTIEPGAIQSELKHGTSHEGTSEWVNELYEQVAIPADSIARAVAYAIEQPADVDINELVIRPTAQEL